MEEAVHARNAPRSFALMLAKNCFGSARDGACGNSQWDGVLGGPNVDVVSVGRCRIGRNDERGRRTLSHRSRGFTLTGRTALDAVFAPDSVAAVIGTDGCGADGRVRCAWTSVRISGRLVLVLNCCEWKSATTLVF